MDGWVPFSALTFFCALVGAGKDSNVGTMKPGWQGCQAEESSGS